MSRVAAVKAMSQASRFFNGSSITDDLIIRTTEDSITGHSTTEIIESIREHSMGYVQGLEQLANFRAADGRQVFIFSVARQSKREKELFGVYNRSCKRANTSSM